MGAMHFVKALIGIILIILSFGYIFLGIPGAVEPALHDVLTVLNGVIPIIVIVIGILIAWIEVDEWKIEKELEKEKAKTEESKGRRKRRS